MFHNVHSDKKHLFVNNIKLDKTKKVRPHRNIVKISAYDKVVQLLTNAKKK